MSNDHATRAALQRLIAEDAVGQLRRRDGLMAALGSEDGALKLDWVEAVARLLADPALLEEVEAEAWDIWRRGIRHVIWAGMGGSVLTVRVLRDLGFCGGHDGGQVTIYPLDSTDPAALNAIVRQVAATKSMMLPTGEEATDRAFLRALLADVMMIGVAMGMTSEEPITHLEWFSDLLTAAGLPLWEHVLVMSLPGSYLERFAHERQTPQRSLQVDGGTGTGGRMSAPATRVFLLPAALYLTTATGFSGQSGRLRSVLQRAWDEYRLELATARPAEHPFVRLAAALSAASRDGVCRLLVRMPEGWDAVVPWLEQLMEESLGKGGQGVVVFDDQPLSQSAPGYREDALLRVRVVTDTQAEGEDGAERLFLLAQPALASQEPWERLAALAAGFLGWQLSMALYGYLHGIQFAGQPAVEDYKARARVLRMRPDPLAAAWSGSPEPRVREGILTLFAPPEAMRQDTQARTADPQRGGSAAGVLARALKQAVVAADMHGQPQELSLSYLDLTVNGEAPAEVLAALEEHARAIGNTLMGIPVKVRRAPAAYHATEQSEMDGPAALVSLRLVARDVEASLLGRYPTTFLHAQAVSTWQAMVEKGRTCFLLVIEGSLHDAAEPLATLFSQVEDALRQM